MLPRAGSERLTGRTKAPAISRLGAVSHPAHIHVITSPVVCEVAAPQRPDAVVAVDPQALQLRLSQYEKSQLEAMLSGIGDVRPRQVDLPLSPPSSSGRASPTMPQPNHRLAATSGRPQSPDDLRPRVGQDIPTVPGSRRRLGRPANRRSLSALSFYGEYCDAHATQRMVSNIWRRLVVSEPEADPAAAAPAAAAKVAAASVADPSAPPAATPAAEAGKLQDGGGVAEGPGTGPPAGDRASSRAGPAAGAGAEPGVGGVRATAAAGEASGGSSAQSQSPNIHRSGADPAALPGAAFDSSSALPASPPRHRVVLYLGPEFQLQLPPPPPPPAVDLPPVFSGAWNTPTYDSGGDSDGVTRSGGSAVGSGGDSEGPGQAWELSEQELLESLTAPPPRTVRGTRLASSQRWRSIGTQRSERGAVKGPTAAATVTAAGRRKSSRVAVATTWQRRGGEGRTGGVEGEGATAKVADRPTGQSVLPGEQQQQLLPQHPHRRQRQHQPDQQRSEQQQRGKVSGDLLPLPPQQQHEQQQQQKQQKQQEREVFRSATWRERQLTLQRDLIEALLDRQDAAGVTDLIQKLHDGNRMGVTALNHVLQVLGRMGHAHSVRRLLTLQVAMGLYNEHTYATAFRGMHRSGRLSLVLGAFQEACRSGRDLGPVACSTLLHIASLERNLKLAWQLFDEMMGHRMTLNRYAYNCMAHIASLLGSLDDVVLVYNMMKAEAAGTGEAGGPPRPDCGPDSYTYSSLVRAAVAVGRGDLLPGMFNEMAAWQRATERAAGRPRLLAPGEGEGRLSTEVWGHFISAASRSGQPDLALRFFDAGLMELGLLPSLQIYNTVLATMARSRPLPQVFEVYRQMLAGNHRPLLSARDCQPPALAAAELAAPGPALTPPGTQPVIRPDHYTFNALLTAAAHHMAPLPTLELIRREMSYHGVSLNTHVGTTFINALRRSPELSRSAAAASTSDATAAAEAGARVVAEAEAVMAELVHSGAATATSYICMTALYVTARRPAEVISCLRGMLACGLAADGSAWHFLMQAAADCDMHGLMPTLQAAQERQQQMAARAQSEHLRLERQRRDQRSRQEQAGEEQQ